MNTEQQKSKSLVVPVLGVNTVEFYSSLINTYLGNVEYEGDDSWGNYIYLELKRDTPGYLIRHLRNHSWFINEYDPTTESIIVVMEPDDDVKKKIIEPFLQGKYSKIDKDYVNKYFNYVYPDGTRPINWLILNKDKSLWNYWENKINGLPKDAEVWSAPRKIDEIYRYEKAVPNTLSNLQRV